jgi:hypothetical protein
MKTDPPQEMQVALDDPKEDNPGIYMTRVDCLTIQIKLEKRLTRLESLNTIQILISLGALLGLITALWKLFGG